MANAKQEFLDTFDREHATTMKVLRAYPADKVDLRPHPKLKTARELAWTFVGERGLGAKVWNDEFMKGGGARGPEAPKNWNEILSALDNASKEWRNLIASTPEPKLDEKVHFFTGPKQMGEISRLDFAWFLLSDEIHHRGQFSVYLRMADAKLPSIYGPTADEPWN